MIASHWHFVHRDTANDTFAPIITQHLTVERESRKNERDQFKRIGCISFITVSEHTYLSDRTAVSGDNFRNIF